MDADNFMDIADESKRCMGILHCDKMTIEDTVIRLDPHYISAHLR